MSGHSHAKNVMRQKERTDKKRSAIFSKLLKAISIAARHEPNPDFNPTLRSAVDKAKANNIPSDNIDRAIKKSSEAGANLEELTLEAYGPDGIAILITAITDNKNRTLPEIKSILVKSGAKPAEPGSVLWAFSKTDDSSWQPNFPQDVSSEIRAKLDTIISNLEDHDDVQLVLTNAN